MKDNPFYKGKLNEKREWIIDKLDMFGIISAAEKEAFKQGTHFAWQELKPIVEGVLKVNADVSGGYEKNHMSICPLCFETFEHDDYKSRMDDIEHADDCIYLKAKELLN